MLIIGSIIVVMLDSVETYHKEYGRLFVFMGWTFTILFTVEYILRLISIQKPWLYVISFLGLVDPTGDYPILPEYIFCWRTIIISPTCLTTFTGIPHL